MDSAAFSPSGFYVVTTSSQDRTVRLWAAESGREIAVLSHREEMGNRLVVTRSAFNSDGTMIVIVSGEESVEVIRAFQTPQDIIDYAKSIAPRDLTPCERQRFFLPVEGDVETARAEETAGRHVRNWSKSDLPTKLVDVCL